MTARSSISMSVFVLRALTTLLGPTQIATKAMMGPHNRWPARSNGEVVVPFTMNPNWTSPEMRQLTMVALKLWQEPTCVSFQEHRELPSSSSHLSFDMKDWGCYSTAYGRSSEAQRVNIGRLCLQIGTIAHEIGHSLGFYHEQARSDRDKYVDIVYDNIQEEDKHNFDVARTHNYVDYDLASVMHYSAKGLTNNGNVTVRPVDPFYHYFVGLQTGPSFRDIKTLNLHYNCAQVFKCGKDMCQNEGYLGRECTCVCPPGTRGDSCETITGDYTDTLMKAVQPFSSRVTRQGSFTSPNYPHFILNETYLQVFESKDECEDVEVHVEEFDMPHCMFATQYKFFITTDGGTDVTKTHCGRTIAPKVFEGPKVTVFYESFLPGEVTVRGYSGTVTFKPKSGCKPRLRAPQPAPAAVKLEISENRCNFQLEEGNDGVYNLRAEIRSHEANHTDCVIPLSTSEPRLLLVTQLTGLDHSRLTSDSSSQWSSNLFLSSNVELKYTGYNDDQTTTRKIDMQIRIVKKNCHKVLQLGRVDAGELEVGHSPCEVWLSSESGRSFEVNIRAKSSPARPNRLGKVWVSWSRMHKYTAADAKNASQLPAKYISERLLNIRTMRLPLYIQYKLI